MVLIRVLGPVEADVDGSLVPLGGPRQRAVLARLVSARGEVVSVDRLIDDLWGGEPPAQAVTSLQAYVSNLRRLLEPGRPPRAPARILVSAAPGYAMALPPDAVDAWRFERLLSQARQAATAPATARALLRDGLSLWRGAAFAEVADEPWAEADVARLDELRRQAEEALVTATLRAGEAAAAVPAADLLTRREPLREEGWRLLALALWASNRQGEALDTLRRARRTLADALGLDPGPELAGLEEAILRQHRDVLTAALRQPASPPAAPAAQPRRRVSRPGTEIFVGRNDELAILLGAADEAAGRGCARVALVSGEPGAGKSALLARLRREIEDRGWLVIGGQCPEADGAPPAWAWVQALRSLAESAPPPAAWPGCWSRCCPSPLRARRGGPPMTGRPMTGRPMTGEAGDPAGDGAGDVSAGRFRLHRAVRAWLIAVAREHRLAIVLDDVHRADAQTTALLAMAGTELTEVPILLLAGYRAAESSPGLATALAALAGRSPVRVQLTGLSEPAVAELVDAVCQQPASPATVTALAERTGGNPFYVRESARLLDSEGALVALSEVPEGVRDVLRRRLGRLPEASVVVLRLAALAGREADIGVLVEAADSDEAGVLDALEAGLIAGLLTEPAAGQVRFVHALVRDALVADLSQLRAARMHARLGAAIERLRPDNLSALAYHYGRAASAATAVQAVDYSVRAAERAERRYAHDAAVGLLTQALDSSERIPADQRGPGRTDRDAQRVALLRRLLAAQLRAGAVAAARATRQQAIDIAEAAGRTDLLIAAFTGWTEPTPWQTRPYGTVDQPVVAQLARLLELPGLQAAVRCRLLEAFTAELAGEGDPRSRAAANQAVELTGELADPALRALALTALARERNSDADWPARGQIAAELITLGTDHDLPAYRSYGYFTAAIAAAADGDVRAVARLLDEGLDLARAYRMPEAEGIGGYGQAMLAHIAGDLAAAERRYTETTARLLRHGSLHAGRFQVLAVATLRVGQGRVAEYAAGAQQLLDAQGPHLADLLTVALAENGQLEQARQMHARGVALRPDFLFSTFAALRAMALIAVGDRGAAAGLYQDLLPLRDQLPGVLSLSLAMRPVAHILGDLAVFLEQPQEAAGHFGHAVTVAERWHAPRWAAEARAARRAIR